MQVDGSFMIKSALSCTIAFIINLIGGFDTEIQSMILFMVVDLATGSIVAKIFKKKNEERSNREYTTKIFHQKIAQKLGMIIIIILAHQIDSIFTFEAIREICVIFFMITESVSIITHIDKMGVPIPKQLIELLELLKNQKEYESQKKKEVDKLELKK